MKAKSWSRVTCCVTDNFIDNGRTPWRIPNRLKSNIRVWSIHLRKYAKTFSCHVTWSSINATINMRYETNLRTVGSIGQSLSIRWIRGIYIDIRFIFAINITYDTCLLIFFILRKNVSNKLHRECFEIEYRNIRDKGYFF